MHRNFIAVLAISALLIAQWARAQQPASPPADQRTSLGKVANPGSGCEVVLGMAELVPDLPSARRSHPGVLMVYLVDGQFWYSIDGQQGRPYKVGDATQIPEQAFPIGGMPSNTAAMAVYIVERTSPGGSAPLPQ
jgi:quercetin dioxygenase-like cupin family protein